MTFQNRIGVRVKDTKIVERNRRWYGALSHVFYVLQKVPYAIIKGEPLSVLAYGETGWRDSQDIDLLISKKYIGFIDDLFKKSGFEQVTFDDKNQKRSLTRQEIIMFANSHQIVPYSKDDIDVDINISILWGEYEGEGIDVDKFLEDTMDLVIYDQRIKTLPAVKMFIQVCLHHYREMNSPYVFKLKNPINIKMFQDVYYLFHQVKDQINIIIYYLDYYNIRPYIYYIVYYTYLLFKDSELFELMQICKNEEGISLLEKYGLTKKERKCWKYDFNTRLNHSDIFSLVENDLSKSDLEKINLSLSIF